MRESVSLGYVVFKMKKQNDGGEYCDSLKKKREELKEEGNGKTCIHITLLFDYPL